MGLIPSCIISKALKQLLPLLGIQLALGNVGDLCSS